MSFDPEHSENEGVAAYLERRFAGGAPVCESPSDVDDPSMSLGAHPDIVERVWDQLGAGLDADCRCVVYRTPSLVDPRSGVVLAVALGTSYALRVAPPDQADAGDAGLERSHHYATVAQTLDVQAEFGSDWFFGNWCDEESRWCRHVFEQTSP